ncbi:TetR/AcrR family transcriptional regulator [Pseudonocardia sp. C8]|uniref:TetR/AcrR family transcriptional regulator n=1 Tax=Pseudonocardia sp. C8 TaxID=2762759 RepID=UPI00164236DA|nr:TetR/AcrR family transcriptional regulator [Pseudonocardia sp. C8]MBC3193034.1 TetR/AcrR family transcriptional regulator [Pseudonocardia sp. C8]
MRTTAAGRPRDPEVDRRIADAAVALFGRTGWAGFSVEGVARAAGVGKASIYLRWESKEQLLGDALARRLVDVADFDSGTLRGDLVRLTRQLLDIYRGESGRAVLRLIVESPDIPGLEARWESLRESQVLAARAMVRRGIARGEIPEDAPVTMVLDTLCGGVLMHVWSAPEHLRARIAADVEAYAEQLVDFLIGAVHGYR